MVKAEEAFDQMFGQDGQNGLVTFTQREDRACEAGDVQVVRLFISPLLGLLALLICVNLGSVRNLRMRSAG